MSEDLKRYNQNNKLAIKIRVSLIVGMSLAVGLVYVAFIA